MAGTYTMGQFSQEQILAIDEAYQEGLAEEARQKELEANTKTREDIQYTLFVSGLRHGRLSEFEGLNQTDNLGIMFDSVERHTLTKTYNKTSYSVESKSKASDNIVTQDGKFSFTGRITDSPYIIDERNYIDKDTDKEKPLEAKRPEKAIEFLVRIADAHQLVTLVTEDNILSGSAITSLTFDRSGEEGAGILVTVELEEFRFKDVSRTVLGRTTDPKKGKKKDNGTKQTAAGGAADDAAKKKKSPYVGKTQEGFEQIEANTVGTTDFSGKAGAKITPTGSTFDPGSLLRK